MSNQADTNKINVIKPTLPAGGGDLKGVGETFSAHEFSGSSGLSIPMPVTPCRGFEPQVSINYSSGNGNGPFGLGWELSLPHISRQTSKRIPKYDDTDTFLYTGDDYLVPQLDTQGQPASYSKTIHDKTYTINPYRSRTAGAFDLIERYTNAADHSDVFWTLTHVDNTVCIFGKTASAKIADPHDPKRIFKWLLEETYDAKGNHQVFEYTPENGKNIPFHLMTDRETSAQRYLSKIRYGNHQPITNGSLILGQAHPKTRDMSWYFEVVFDYGEYHPDPKNVHPYTVPDKNQWACRQDPFSDYRAGFEIRTYRLCHNILLFHRFPDEFKTQDPVLTHRLNLAYQPSPALTLLTEVQSIGYHFSKGAYHTKSLPSLELGYSRFEPADARYTPHDFAALHGRGGEDLIGLSRDPYQLVDLYGGGIPGVLYADGETVRYRKPLRVSPGEITYGAWEDIHFPMSRRAQDQTHTLTDLTGNGKLDLLVSTAQQTGFYEINGEGVWKPWQPLASVPTVLMNPDVQHADVSGDGCADLLLIEHDQVRVYPSQRSEGYGSARSIEHWDDLPLSGSGDRKNLITFADMCGLGQGQLVHITSNRVVCRPSLGYGRFGTRITLNDAPDFGPNFDTARLHLTDVDGTGTMDLAYIYPNHVAIFLNQSGNGFSKTPITIPLPQPWDNLDQIQFADVRGNGTACLVFSTALPQPRQWFYDFNEVQWKGSDGTSERISLKPYLLIQTQNNMGALTRIRYESSTRYFLQDQAAGLHWATRLPFPVQVIDTVTHVDKIAGTTTISAYQYHHGYYDGYEREFRGFGRVDRTDTQSFDAFLPPGNEDDEAAYQAPPLLTKTWYHTGAWLQECDLTAAFRKEYWKGDKQAGHLPDTAFEFLDPSFGVNVCRDAHRTLHGHVLRTEVYGRDATPWQDTPYAVSESQVTVKQLQHKGPCKYAVFMLHDRQSISYDYERNPDDPRVSQHFILEVDSYGHVLKSAAVTYGRRENQIPAGLDAQTVAQQKAIRIVYDEHTLINSPQIKSKPDFYLLGLPLTSKSYEVTGCTPQYPYFSFTQLQNALQGATKKLLHWNRSYYYDATEQKELPLGEITAQALHCRTELATFDKTALPNGIKNVAIRDLSTVLEDQGGYVTMPASDPDGKQARRYYWNPGNFQLYGLVDDFYLPAAFYDPFQYRLIKEGASWETIPRTTYTYDTYHLTVTKVTDPLGNTSTLQVDYQYLAPTVMTDINGNTSEVLLDPLGMVIASSFYGTENGKPVGFDKLNAYEPSNPPNLDQIMKEPEKYLQKAARYFFYDLFSWQHHTVTEADLKPIHVDPKGLWQNLQNHHYISHTGAVTAASRALLSPQELDISGLTDQQKQQLFQRLQGTPVHFVSLKAQCYPKAGNSQDQIQKAVTYSDGFGRHLQSKAFLDSSEEVRQWDPSGRKVVARKPPTCWLTSGALRYNHKGQPIKHYEPYYSSDYLYVNEQLLNEVGYSSTTFYDSLGHGVLSITPEGFLTKTLRGAWDAHKPNSSKYQGYLNQKLYESLPGTFLPSPWSTLQFDANDTIDDAHYIPPKSDLVAVGDDSATQAGKCMNTPMIAYLDSLGRTVQHQQLKVGDTEKDATFIQLDILGNILTTADERHHKASTYNFEMCYNLSRENVKTISADAGTTWQFSNVAGNPYWHRDSRETTTTHTFDALHRPVSTTVHNTALSLNQIVQRTVYGDTQDDNGNPVFSHPQTRNLRGKPVVAFDQSGLNLAPFFTLHGHPQASGKLLTENYKQEPKWDSINDQDLKIIADVLEALPRPSVNALKKIPDLCIKNLEKEIYATSSTYDAQGRTVSATDPDGNTVTSHYDTIGRLKSTTTSSGAFATARNVTSPDVAAFRYNARGQQTTATYGNGITTTHTYDEKNFRLLRITSSTTRKTLQELVYQYDPVGNVTSLKDNVTPTVFFDGQKVDAKNTYTYDTLYRLVTASGREHTGMWRNPRRNQCNMGSSTRPQPINNHKALQRYTQSYIYDSSGNLTQVSHAAKASGPTRKLTIRDVNNQLAKAALGQEAKNYKYDQNGNQTTIGGVQTIEYNYRNNLSKVTVTDKDTEYYVYDAGGSRVRKVRVAASDKRATQISEVIYLGGFEIRRRSRSDHKTNVVAAEWHWVSVAGCRWGYLTAGSAKRGTKPNQQRYQLDNRLNSSTMEVDENGDIITYEEYYPYGGTAIIAAKSQRDAKQRYYRYSGKEADDATGLYYYGMRYYCPWLGRWTAPDPAGTVDGLNIFAFVRSNPATHVDIDGRVTQTRCPRTQSGSQKQRTLRTKPPTYQELQGRAGRLGQQLGGSFKTMSAARINRLKTRFAVRNRLLSQIQKDYGLEAQDQSLVKSAVREGLIGNTKSSDQHYHDALPGHDEQAGTNSIMTPMLAAFGEAYHGRVPRKTKEAFTEAVTSISWFRMLSGETGSSPDVGLTIQHPGPESLQMFGTRGENHPFADRARADAILSKAEKTFKDTRDPDETLSAIAATSGEYTVGHFAAPATAYDQNTFDHITRSQEVEQTRHRDGIKQGVFAVRGETPPQTTQDIHADALMDGSITPMRASGPYQYA